MKKWTMITTGLMSLLLASTVFGHGGHHHDEASGTKPKKGGVVKEVGDLHVELVALGGELKLYFYDGGMKELPTTGLRLEAEAVWPRKKKTEKIEWAAKEDHFLAQYQAPGTHRYDLQLKVLEGAGPKPGSVKFVVETRK